MIRAPGEDVGRCGKPATPLPGVYACSGCSDAGELAYRIARGLTTEGVAQMSCLVGIGGRVQSLLAKAENSESIRVVDGCPLNCARKTLELDGLRGLTPLGLHEVGTRKGSCPVTGENISTGAEAASRALLRTSRALRPGESPKRHLGNETQEAGAAFKQPNDHDHASSQILQAL